MSNADTVWGSKGRQCTVNVFLTVVDGGCAALAEMIYFVIGILGATVMLHTLGVHYAVK